MRDSLLTVSLLVALIVVGGCNPAPETADTPPNAAPSSEPTEAQLPIVTLEQVQGRIQEHRGQVVVVDLWALWCGHCVAELPHFAQLPTKFPKQVHAISLNVDFDETTGAPSPKLITKIRKTLSDNGVEADDLVCSTPFEDVLASLDIFSLPACLIYAPDGTLAKKIEGAVSYESDVFPLLETLVSSEQIQ